MEWRISTQLLVFPQIPYSSEEDREEGTVPWGVAGEKNSCLTQPIDVFDDLFLDLLDNGVLFGLHQCCRI